MYKGKAQDLKKSPAYISLQCSQRACKGIIDHYTANMSPLWGTLATEYLLVIIRFLTERPK